MNKKAFFTLSIVIFASTIGMSILSPLMSLYADQMGASGIWLGIMFSGFSLSRALFQPISGWLSDSKDRKMLVIIGLGAYTLISLGYAVASTLYTLTAVRLLHGVASALVTPVAQAYVGDIIPKGKEGTYMNIFMMAMYLGMAMGPFLGGALNQNYGMNVAFYVMAAMSAFALFLHVIFVPKIKARSHKSRAGWGAMLTLLKDNRMKAVALHLSSRGILRQGITAFLPLYSAKLLGFDTTTIGLVTSIFAFTEAISQGLVGPIADRMNKKTLIIGGSLIAAVVVFFGSNMTDALGQLLILVPVAIMASTARAAASAYSVEVGAKHNCMGACMGLANASQDLGHFIGPVLFGWAIDAFGESSIFAVGGISGLIAIPPMIYYLLAKQPEETYTVVTEPVPVKGSAGGGNGGDSGSDN